MLGMVAIDGIGLALAFTSSASDACHEATQKALAAYMPHPELALALKSGIIAGVFVCTYFTQEHEAWPRLVGTFGDRSFLTAWAVAGAINVGANFLMILGMKRGKMSDTVPYLSLSPVFLLGSGYVFLGELADANGMAGVAVIAAGGFWLSRAGAADEVNDKPGDSPSSKSTTGFLGALPPGAGIYMLIAMIQSVSSAFDKRGVRAAAAPVLYGATISATVAAFALIKFAWQQWRSGEGGGEKEPSEEASKKEPSEEASKKEAPSGTKSEAAGPTPQRRKVMRRRSSAYLADLNIPDLWEQAEESEKPSQTPSPPTEKQEQGQGPSGQGRQTLRRRSSFLGTDVLQMESLAADPPKPRARDESGAPAASHPKAAGQRLLRRRSSLFMAPDLEPEQKPASVGNDAEKPSGETASAATRWGLMLLACALKMMAYWCQLKANERILSSQVSAIRKSGVLLVLLLGKLLFSEEIGNKLMPVATMLMGVAVLVAK